MSRQSTQSQVSILFAMIKIYGNLTPSKNTKQLNNFHISYSEVSADTRCWNESRFVIIPYRGVSATFPASLFSVLPPPLPSPPPARFKPQEIPAMGGGRRWPLKLLVKGTSSPVRLAVGIAVAGLAWNASPRPAVAADSSFSSSREKINSAVDGVIRSSRAIYTVCAASVSFLSFWPRVLIILLLLYRSPSSWWITSILCVVCLPVRAITG